MAGEAADAVAPHKRLVRGALVAWALFIYVFLFAPIILLILFSFNANQYGTLPITGWTLHWYHTAFSDFQIQDALKTTLSVALEVTVIATIVGTAAAFPLVR
ncbi:MAG: ABC transporter permease, partial [Solirubrobacteraceae bacterium]